MKEQLYIIVPEPIKIMHTPEGVDFIRVRIVVSPAKITLQGKIEADITQQPADITFHLPTVGDAQDILGCLKVTEDITTRFTDYIKLIRDEQRHRARTRKVIPFPTSSKLQ